MPGPLTISIQDSERIDKVTRIFNRDYPVFREHWDEQEDGYSYLAGQQFTQKQERWYVQQRRPARTFNLILPSFNVTLGDFLLNELNVDVYPQPGGTQQMASAFRDLIDHVNIDNDIDAVFQRVALAGLVKVGFIHPRYSDEKYPDGSIVISDSDEFQIMWEQDAKDLLLDDAGHLIRSSWKDKNEIIAFYPEHREELKRLLEDKDYLANTNLSTLATMTMANRDYVDERDGKYRIVEYRSMQWEDSEVFYDPVTGISQVWNFEGKKADLVRARYPQGKIIKSRAKIKYVTYCIPGLHFHLSHKKADLQDQFHDYIPFSAFGYGMRTIGNFGIFRNAKSPQDDLNSWRNALNYLIHKIINPGTIYKPEHFENPEHLEAFYGVPGEHIKVDSTENFENIIKSLGDYLTKLPFAPDQLSKESADFLQRIVNVTESLYGVQESSSEPASLFAQKVKRALVAFHGMYSNWSRVKRRLYHKVLLLTQTHMTSQRYFLIRNPKTGDFKELMLNWQVGDKILNDVSTGRYGIVTDDMDKHPTAKFARFRQKSEVVQMVQQLFGGAISNPAAIISMLRWWLTDSDLGDIEEFIKSFEMALGMQQQQMQDYEDQTEAIGVTNAMLDMAQKQLSLMQGNQAGLGAQAPGSPQNNKPK